MSIDSPRTVGSGEAFGFSIQTDFLLAQIAYRVGARRPSGASAWKRARSPRCPSRRRNNTNAASAFICDIEKRTVFNKQAKEKHEAEIAAALSPPIVPTATIEKQQTQRGLFGRVLAKIRSQ